MLAQQSFTLVTLTVQKEQHSSRVAVVAPSIHRKSNQAVRHMKQLSRHSNDATHKAVSHMTELTRRHVRMTNPQSDTTANTLTTNALSFVRRITGMRVVWPCDIDINQL
ncbi:hypothetical protein TNCV_1649951 [Trichonephila clavipes]|nr:hypothetical protein TNCV_1649951 [Trichonephila clavipes]